MKILRLRYLGVLAICLWGCMKNPEYTQDFGPEVSEDAITQAVNDAPTADVYSIKKGEYASSQKTQQIQANQSTVIYQESNTVTDKTEDTTTFYFTIVKKINELIDGQMKPSTSEIHATLPKQTTAPATSIEVPTVSMESIHTQAADGSVTFHNLRVESISVAIPSLVLQRSDCGGLPTDVCHSSLPAKRISFDQVHWSDGVGTKYAVSFTISAAVPFFAAHLQQCLEANIPYQQQLVHVIQCDSMVDFTAGHN